MSVSRPGSARRSAAWETPSTSIALIATSGTNSLTPPVAEIISEVEVALELHSAPAGAEGDGDEHADDDGVHPAGVRDTPTASARPPSVSSVPPS
ncbi:hypothetical protein SMICM17S_07492 [Streptomyces microflavus]